MLNKLYNSTALSQFLLKYNQNCMILLIYLHSIRIEEFEVFGISSMEKYTI